MHPRSLHRSRRGLGVFLTAAGVLAACSPGDGADQPSAAADDRPCVTPTDSIIGLSTEKFVGFVSPKPHRFLIPVSTDSALPTNAYWALQKTAATLNFLPRDTVAQKQVLRQLSPNGSLTLLLVNYHGQEKLADGRVAVEFSGHYLAGSPGGTAVPRTTVTFSCHAEGERFAIEAPAAGT